MTSPFVIKIHEIEDAYQTHHTLLGKKSVLSFSLSNFNFYAIIDIDIGFEIKININILSINIKNQLVFTVGTDIINMIQSTKRAWSGRKRERALRPGSRIHLGRGGQSANSVKLYKISSWEPGKKHQSTCRAS